MGSKLTWQTKTTPVELQPMLGELGKAYPISKSGSGGTAVTFIKTDKAGTCTIKRKGTAAEVTYGSPAQAGRAIGALLSGFSSAQESTPFTSLGIMLDCSRNAVMTVEHLKVWFRRLALLGYNMVMLYTEDTYELPGEPYFGYQRGAYTAKELKAIDDYAAKLGITVIPCIQTLGHLAQILKHWAYRPIKDTGSVMMVGEKKTYQLIEKMIKQWKEVCRSDRIHIGMDETHDLGRGRYHDINGYKAGFDLFNEHLGIVVQLCKKHGLKPMIWSDMYFRLSNKDQNYYDKSSVIPKSVIKKIPPEAELVYWDYYNTDKAFYKEWIKRHRQMKKEPLMGSGIWTWNRYWYDHAQTVNTAGPCIEACYDAKLKEVFFTQWGDNGAYCDHDSAFAGMVYCAEKAYGCKQPKDAALEKRFAAVCGGSYKAHILASSLHSCFNGFPLNMWDDPIFETSFRTNRENNPRKMAKMAGDFAKLATKLKKHTGDRATGDLNHAYIMTQAFADRYTLSSELLAAYRKQDKRKLRAVAAKIPALRKSIRRMADSFRTMWMSHNKPQGLETIQGRFGMLDARYQELSLRLKEYLAGKVKDIAELECDCPPK